MPRVADIYSRPAGIDAVTNATIDSSDYNLNVADVENDLNIARPIVAGGTGADSAAGARDNLDAERAGQQVMNFDTHVWENGSFWSNNAATNPPVASHAFSGIVHMFDTLNFTVEARDLNDPTNTPGMQYIRQKKGGVWGAWTLLPGSSVGQYVLKVGDTMTGNLTIKPAAANPGLVLDKPALTTSISAVTGSYNGEPRWQIRLGDTGDLDNGTSTGSDFAIYRFNDAGGGLGVPLTINRATGTATFEGYLQTNNARIIINHLAGANPGLLFQSAGTTRWDFQVVDAGEDFVLSRNGATRVMTFNRAAGNVAVLATTVSNASTNGALTVAGGVGIAGALALGTTFAAPAGVPPGTGVGLGNTIQGIGFDGIGTTYHSRTGTICASFNVNQDGSNLFFQRSGATVGSVSVTTTATAYNTSSDARLKEDLKAFDAGHIIDQTEVYDFAWKATGKRAYGVVAQEAVEVYDTPVFHDEAQDRWFVDYSKYVPVLLQELKALRARVAELEAKVV